MQRTFRWRRRLGLVAVVLGLVVAGVVAVPRLLGSNPDVETFEGVGESLAWSPDGQILSITSSDIIWLDPATGEITQTVEVGRINLRWHVWSPDRTMLAAADDDEEAVVILDTTTGEVVASFEGHTDNVASIAWSPDGTILASASWDTTIRLWDVATGETIQTLDHIDAVTSVAWSPDGTVLATGGSSGDLDEMHVNLKLWDTATGEIIHEIKADSWISYLTFSPDGSTFATESRRGVQVRDVISGAIAQTLQTSSITSVAWSPDGARVAISEEHTVTVWNPDTGELLDTLETNPDEVNEVVWSPDNTRLTIQSVTPRTRDAAFNEGSIKLWTVKTA